MQGISNPIYARNIVFSGISQNGIDGNRTRVQRPLPCTSTSVVYA